ETQSETLPWMAAVEPAGGSKSVEGGGVVVQDLAAGRLGEIDGEHRLDGLRPLVIGMRVIAGEEDPVLADRAHQLRQARLVGLAGDPALAPDVRARGERDVRLSLDAAGLLPVRVHAPEPVRQPPAARFP